MTEANPVPSHRLIAYPLGAAGLQMPLVPAPTARAWMDELIHPYHCLPLKMANQSGWLVLNGCGIDVVWSGGKDRHSLTVRGLDGGKSEVAVSQFGYGLLTFHIPYLFRTPAGYNLLARGPANHPKDGAFALEGLVETDWSPAPFFMTWVVTKVNQPVRFERGEPICMIVPQRRGELESFAPELHDLASEPLLEADYMRWCRRRKEFLREAQASLAGVPENWVQREYTRGQFADGPVATEHQTSLRLQQFEDRRSSEAE
jgi:hypothetical protein